MNERKDQAAIDEDDDRIPVDGPEQIPNFATDEEEREFWRTHTFSEKFWREAPAVPDDELPPVRARRKR